MLKSHGLMESGSSREENTKLLGRLSRAQNGLDYEIQGTEPGTA